MFLNSWNVLCQNDRCVLAPDGIADRIVTNYTNLKSITIKTVDLIVCEFKYICKLTTSLLNEIVDIIKYIIDVKLFKFKIKLK